MALKPEQSEAEAVWAANEPYIRRICAYKLSSHPHEAEDAVQEIALAFFEAIRKGTQIRDPKKWLTVVASNIIKDSRSLLRRAVLYRSTRRTFSQSPRPKSRRNYRKKYCFSVKVCFLIL